MAEALGVAAGVVGVLSFSVQVAQTSSKLSSLLKSIKDLPEELESMTNELDILSDFLQQYENASVAGKRATHQLQKLSKLLQNLLDDSQAYIRRSKHKYSWRAIKVTMKKDEINRLYNRMANCRNLLHIVNQMDFQESQKSQLDAIQQSQSKDSENIASILNFLTRRTDDVQQDENLLTIQQQTISPDNAFSYTPATTPRNRRYGDSWDFISCYWFLIGYFYFYQVSSRKRRVAGDDFANDCNVVKGSSPWKIKFRAAPWLTSRGFTVWRTACYGDWQYRYRPHRLRPSDAPIFEACRQGQVESVRNLLSHGEASPFDMDQSGRTPLHYAVALLHLDVCKVLIDNGADCNEGHSNFANLLHYQFGMSFQNKYDDEDRSVYFQIIKLLTEQGQCDPTILFDDEKVLRLYLWLGPRDVLQWFCLQNQLWLEIPEDGGSSHFYHSLAMLALLGGPSALLNIFWTQERIPYILHSRSNDSETVLFCAVEAQALVAIYSLPGHQDYQKKIDPSIDQLVTRLIREGSPVHALDKFGYTPLNNALILMAEILENRPFGVSKSTVEYRTVFIIRKTQSQYQLLSSRSIPGAQSDEYKSKTSHFGQFLSWWFQRLDEGGKDLTDYIRQEQSVQNPQHPLFRKDYAAAFSKFSTTFHYDASAQYLEVIVKWTWLSKSDMNSDIVEVSEVLEDSDDSDNSERSGHSRDL